VDTGQVAATPAVPGATGAAPARATPATASPAGSAAYTVQVAAYSTQQAADATRARLASQGYAARVVGVQKPFRVRVGRYATRAQAEPVAKAIHGYVTEAEPR